jgi:1,4-dihydroxy-2-naphthoyl-CoA synthase
MIIIKDLFCFVFVCCFFLTNGPTWKALGPMHKLSKRPVVCDLSLFNCHQKFKTITEFSTKFEASIGSSSVVQLHGHIFKTKREITLYYKQLKGKRIKYEKGVMIYIVE